MSISHEVPELSPGGVVAEVVAALRELTETLWSARTDDELVAVVEQVQQASAALAVIEAGALAEADVRDVAKQSLHFGSTGDWLTHVGGLHRGEGKRRVVRAKALTGPLARTRQGWSTVGCRPSRPTSSCAASRICRPRSSYAVVGRSSWSVERPS
jgi:hypothetical protein